MSLARIATVSLALSSLSLWSGCLDALVGPSHVGKLASSDALVAAVIDDTDGQVAVYVCDGNEAKVETASWFRGELEDGRAQLASIDGAELVIEQGVEGQSDVAVEVRRGSPEDSEVERLNLTPVSGADGMYFEEHQTAEGDLERAGWIVFGDEKRGAIRVSSSLLRTVAALAPPTTATQTTGSSTMPSTVGSPLEPAAVQAMLDAHNQVRTTALPAPSPALPAMAWSNELSRLAQDWANGCNFSHNTGRGTAGENIAFTSSSALPIDFVAMWAAEKSSYDYATDACLNGAECRHYTQLVWRATTLVGCGVASCPAGTVASIQTRYAVCNYQSAGNVVGQKPY